MLFKKIIKLSQLISKLSSSDDSTILVASRYYLKKKKLNYQTIQPLNYSISQLDLKPQHKVGKLIILLFYVAQIKNIHRCKQSSIWQKTHEPQREEHNKKNNYKNPLKVFHI